MSAVSPVNPEIQHLLVLGLEVGMLSVWDAKGTCLLIQGSSPRG